VALSNDAVGCEEERLQFGFGFASQAFAIDQRDLLVADLDQAIDLKSVQVAREVYSGREKPRRPADC
jgi:hypothetical protein